MLSNIRILYADDDPQVLASLAHMTQAYGWTGDQATSATEVVNKVNKKCSEGGPCYDAIITAINFFSGGTDQTITGVTAAKLIRKAQADIPIIFLSGHSNTILREEVRRVDAELVSKPVDLESLFEKVSRLIEWHRVTQANRTYQGEERRLGSINLTDHFRRQTDTRDISVPERLEKILNEVKDERR